ncbi:MAG: phasin family protein [Gammaproteobacteria bacterium]
MQAQFNDLYATRFDVMKRIAESNWQAWDRLTKQQIKLLGVYADCGQRQYALRNGNGVQRPADFLAAQADIARQLAGQLVQYSQVMFTGTLETAKELMSCIEGSEPPDRTPNYDGGETETLKPARPKRAAT